MGKFAKDVSMTTAVTVLVPSWGRSFFFAALSSLLPSAGLGIFFLNFSYVKGFRLLIFRGIIMMVYY